MCGAGTPLIAKIPRVEFGGPALHNLLSVEMDGAWAALTRSSGFWCMISAMSILAHPRRPLRVAMLARVVYPLHGFGGIERHVFHLVSHLEQIDVRVTLFVQSLADSGPAWPNAHPPSQIVYLRYDYTTPILPPNGVIGRQFNYPWYSWQLGLAAAAQVRRGDFDIVHSQGLCALGYGAIRSRDPLLRRIPFVANPHGMEEFRTPDWRKWIAYAPFRAMYAYGHRVADRAIATDACTQGDLPRYLKVDPRKVAVIPSAIDIVECLGMVRADLRVALRARLGLTGAAVLAECRSAGT